MANAAVIPPGASLICQKVSFGQFLKSSLGVLNLIAAPLTLGVSLLAAYLAHRASVDAIWIVNDRLFASKILPADGRPVAEVQWTWRRHRLLFFTINRTAQLYPGAATGKEFVEANAGFVGAEGFERLLATLNAVQRSGSSSDGTSPAANA